MLRKAIAMIIKTIPVPKLYFFFLNAKIIHMIVRLLRKPHDELKELVSSLEPPTEA